MLDGDERWSGKDYYTVRCADCDQMVATMKPFGPVVCLDCAAGNPPPQPPLFCPKCGTQRSRFDEGSCQGCVEAYRRERETAYEAEHGPEWREVLRSRREEHNRMGLQMWEELSAE